MIDKDRDYDLIIKIIEICFVEKQLHASQKISILDWIWIFRKKKNDLRDNLFLGQNFEKKFARNRGARGAKRSLSLSLRYKCGVIDQVLRKPYTCIEHDLSDISRQVSLIRDVARPTKYVLDCTSVRTLNRNIFYICVYVWV